MDWKCVKHRCSSGRRCWKRESADWKTGFECSGRRSLKGWAKRTGSNGFKKWNGSAGLSCFAMGVGSWTTGDCELRRGKRETGESTESQVLGCKSGMLNLFRILTAAASEPGSMHGLESLAQNQGNECQGSHGVGPRLVPNCVHRQARKGNPGHIAADG